ncbi:unnamed protein product [Brassicogethes aeneus]|uniref:Uncharacterized protein n=1 Tax=Brassicogethes aeneus TaxID=1431903 RepID=A0A9P0FIV0_BRAAE|nr:unnamed protein product [Brassicogethes aeneus]
MESFTPPYQSVVELSEECIKRLAAVQDKSNAPPTPPKEEHPQQEEAPQEIASEKQAKEENFCPPEPVYQECELDDCEIIRMLKCTDEKHSIENGLTKEDFEALYEKVSSQIHITYNMPCNQNQLLKCLQRNPDCSIKCQGLANSFIDCVDKERIIKIKEKIEIEQKERRIKQEEEFKKLLEKNC